MSEKSFKYAIIGGGLTGDAAVKGIRELDHDGAILLIGKEKHLPYDRPPLSKKLWFGKKRIEDIFLHDADYYAEQGVELCLGAEVISLDIKQRTFSADNGGSYKYEKLLLATGGTPRRLDLPSGDLEGVCYYRYLEDYLSIRGEAAEGKSAVVIGGGFIGTEIAAALNINKLKVTMLFPEEYIVSRVFPEGLGRAIQEAYIARGVGVLAGDTAVSLEKLNGKFTTNTKGGKRIESDIVIVGVGLVPTVELAQRAGLEIENGVVVNEYLQTSNADIYAAGDLANFPYQALGQRRRIEHWDNALHQGAHAGLNMTGAMEPFTYMPYFFSDLFDFGYEAVGEVDSRLETFADWKEENKTGVIYYLAEGKVRGAMMCNVWDKVDAARELIRKGERVKPEKLKGAIS
jgi:NADPH-dependent 2,4-dienoyl-CoA reductase/sulfur reductase-like enzyme